MRSQILGLGLVGLLCACGKDDLHRMAGIPQGTLVVGLGMPMREVVKRSTVKFGHRLALAGSSTGSYADGNAYFDFELAGSGLRFHGCSMYSIDYEGPDEIVTLVNVCTTPDRSRWSAYTRELRETAAKLKADGWEREVARGQPSVESFMARDGSSLGTTDSGVIAVFEWRKGSSSLQLSANRAWDSAQFWSMVDVTRAAGPLPTAATERWLGEFPAYPGAQFVCRQHVSGAGERALHINWSLYATTDDPAEVAAFYAGVGNLTRGSVGATVSRASLDGLKHLSAHPVAGSYPDCQVKPPAEARTVFIVSQGTRPP